MITGTSDRYKRLAYTVIRDAMAFYLGIPVFMENLAESRETELLRRFHRFTKLRASRGLAADPAMALRTANISVNNRIKQLNTDYSYCEAILTEPNIWSDLLDLADGWWNVFLAKSSPDELARLRIVPTWSPEWDAQLSRPYLDDAFWKHITG